MDFSVVFNLATSTGADGVLGNIIPSGLSPGGYIARQASAEFSVSDDNGNTTSYIFVFYIDDRPPGLQINLPSVQNGAVVPFSALTGIAIDFSPIASLTIQITDGETPPHYWDGVKFTTNSIAPTDIAIPVGTTTWTYSNFTSTAIQPGQTFVFTVTGTDSFGNIGTTTATLSSPPVINTPIPINTGLSVQLVNSGGVTFAVSSVSINYAQLNAVVCVTIDPNAPATTFVAGDPNTLDVVNFAVQDSNCIGINQQTVYFGQHIDQAESYPLSSNCIASSEIDAVQNSNNVIALPVQINLPTESSFYQGTYNPFAHPSQSQKGDASVQQNCITPSGIDLGPCAYQEYEIDIAGTAGSALTFGLPAGTRLHENVLPGPLISPSVGYCAKKKKNINQNTPGQPLSSTYSAIDDNGVVLQNPIKPCSQEIDQTLRIGACAFQNAMMRRWALDKTRHLLNVRTDMDPTSRTPPQ